MAENHFSTILCGFFKISVLLIVPNLICTWFSPKWISAKYAKMNTQPTVIRLHYILWTIRLFTSSSTKEPLWLSWTPGGAYSPLHPSPSSEVLWRKRGLWNISAVFSENMKNLSITWIVRLRFFLKIHKIKSINFFLSNLYEYSTTGNMIFQEYNIYTFKWFNGMLVFFFKIKIITYSLLIKKRHILKLTLIFPWKSIFTGANAVAFNLSTINNVE